MYVAVGAAGRRDAIKIAVRADGQRTSQERTIRAARKTVERGDRAAGSDLEDEPIASAAILISIRVTP